MKLYSFKKFFIALLVVLVALRVVFPSFVLADSTATDEATLVTPTVTPTPSIDVTNTATVDNAVSSTSNSGSNTIEGQDSTPSATFTATDSAILDATPSATPTPTIAPTDTTTTGDAITNTTVDNTINTNTVNSQIIYQTINIFLDENGNLDLTQPITIAEKVATDSANPTTDVVMSGQNYAKVDNAIVASADTGDNTTSGPGNVVINTGNAYSIVSLLNKVNLTLIDSTIHIITINIYGNFTGNIILPDLENTNACTSCSMAMTVDNTANVNNDVNNLANTGENTIASSSGSITTGDATSMVNITNILNTVLYEALFGHIYINTYGTWNGNFLGWGDTSSQSGNTSLDISMLEAGTGDGSCPGCSVYLNSTNNADITNNIQNTANTGDNTTYGSSGNITTGNAYAFTNIINFINTTFIHTNGLLGFINIFGSLTGDIGSAKYFPAPTPPAEQNAEQNTDTPTVHKEDGGGLSVTTSNNVGAYVLPGDTVTFFANVQNTGSGKVYDAKLHLSLMKEGQEVGGADFALGDIAGGHGVKLSTGLVLSNAIEPGMYTARVTATGTTGDENTPLTASAESNFFVSGLGYQNSSPKGPDTILPQQQMQDILGSTTQNTPKDSNTLLFVLLGIIVAYISVRVLRAKEQLILFFTPGKNFKQRLNTLRLFLL